MTFHVGQKVVCVKAEWSDLNGETAPVAGGIYTIRAIITYPDDFAGLLLVEIINAPRYYAEGLFECDFIATKFRPIVERKTDISIFTAMLTGSKIGADA
jgi:hypothetical protein